MMFKCVPVRDFVKRVRFGKIWVNKREEAFADIGFYILAVRRIEPCYFPFVVLFARAGSGVPPRL